jgi:hypothetical protein
MSDKPRLEKLLPLQWLSMQRRNGGKNGYPEGLL